MSDLATIFRILAYPNKVATEPAAEEEKKVLALFAECDYFYALRFFKGLSLASETAAVKRTVHYYERAGTKYLAFVEVEKPRKKKEDDGTAQEH